MILRKSFTMTILPYERYGNAHKLGNMTTKTLRAKGHNYLTAFSCYSRKKKTRFNSGKSLITSVDIQIVKLSCLFKSKYFCSVLNQQQLLNGISFFSLVNK